MYIRSIVYYSYLIKFNFVSTTVKLVSYGDGTLVIESQDGVAGIIHSS